MKKITLHLTILLLITLFANKIVLSSTISGKIMDKDSVSILFANVYVKNTTYGAVSNYKGDYFVDIAPGSYTLVFSSLGFINVEKEIVIKKNEKLVLNIIMYTSDVMITDIEIVADKIDRAKRIIKNARENRKLYLNNFDNFECNSYVKTSIEKESEEKIVDSTKNSKDFESYIKNEKLNLIEYVAQTFFTQPNRFKENVTAYHNYSEEKPNEGVSISVDAQYGENNIAPTHNFTDDPYIFYKNSTSGNFNFNENLLNFPALCEQPLVSPIASNSPLYYKYEFIECFTENGTKINKIKVIPLNKIGALFNGTIFIEDSTWAVVSVDLFINEEALTLYQNFNIIQNYQKIDSNIYLPIRTDITYTIGDKDEKILGSSKIINKDYKVNQDINKKIFSNEIISYNEDAFDKDSVYWEENRPISLKSNELDFIDKTDSIQEYYKSEKYLDQQDSAFNAIRWWTPLAYYGYKNHNSGIEFFVGGLVQQVVPFGVGGYRHRLPFYIYKRLDNGMLIETKYQIDYGFRNKDLKGKVGVGLTYLPKKFVRTFVEIGDNYDLINNYAAFEQVFSRSNYVRTKSLSVSQRMEIFNGFYGELTFLYSNQIPIDNIKLEKWSAYLFGDYNTPIEFEQYIKTEVKLELKYLIGQKYIIRKNAKLIIGTDFPEISFIYRKGIPNLLSSEVNFDYLELGAKYNVKLARLGDLRWQIKAGIFLNKKDLRILEYKYFRGSDSYFFIDPVNSMQLLGLTLNTNYQYLQANAIHHFTGIINKIPIIKLTKITLAAGAGTLNIPEQNFYHFEMFGGIERVFKFKKQLFRVGAYAVTSDNTLSKADFQFKFGVSFFDSYTNKWGY